VIFQQENLKPVVQNELAHVGGVGGFCESNQESEQNEWQSEPSEHYESR
jgi:hypothetical protein